MSGWTCEECLVARATVVVKLPNGTHGRLTCDEHRELGGFYVMHKWNVREVHYGVIPQPDKAPDPHSAKQEGK